MLQTMAFAKSRMNWYFENMKWIEDLFKKKIAEYKFIYPYSGDAEIRREQLMQNFQTGILLEDLKVLIPWHEPFRNLERFVRKHTKTNNQFNDEGMHVIMDGLTITLDPHKRMSNYTPFSKLESFLGFDDIGHTSYLIIRDHIVHRFGQPTEQHNWLPYHFYGDQTLYWKFQGFQISLPVWERYAIHYSLEIACT
jgi:hypothetical protein